MRNFLRLRLTELARGIGKTLSRRWEDTQFLKNWACRSIPSLTLLLFMTVSVSANVTFEFDVLDETLKQGDTLKIDIFSSRKLIKPTAKFAGRSWKVTYIKPGYADGKKHYQYVLYAGVSRYLKPKTYNCVFKLPTSKHSHYKKTIPIDVKDAKFPFGVVKLPKAKKKIANNKKQSSKEVNLITKKFGADSKPLGKPLFHKPFILPAKGRMSSPYGKFRKYEGTTRRGSKHSGTDIANVVGTDIVASNDGVINLSSKLNTHGETIMIDHGAGIKTIYNHLSKRLVKVGDKVSRGQVIGKMGNTGVATGSHLHWGFGVQNVRVDPMQWVDNKFLLN